MKAMILAAGRGERMRPLTDRLPKPLLEVAGRPLIDYHLGNLHAAGVREVVINLAWLGQRIREFVKDGSRWGLRVHFSDEGREALETAGGIVAAQRWLSSEPFLVVNGDIYCDFEFSRLRLHPGALATLVLVANPTHHPRGDFSLDAAGIVGSAPTRLTFSGIAIYDPTLFAGLASGKRKLLDVLAPEISAGRIMGVRHDGLWHDVGTPERLRDLDRQVRLATASEHEMPYRCPT
ncbi:MAG: nucleotidyltransferase family protein [Steroidobacteraceae bacterium]